MPRATELTKAVETAICAMIREGNTILDAARSVGIHKATVNRWRVKGRGNKAPAKYRSFRQAVERAKADSKAELVARIYRASALDWKAAMAILERRHPGEWGKRPTAIVISQGKSPEKLTDAELALELAAMQAKLAGKPA